MNTKTSSEAVSGPEKSAEPSPPDGPTGARLRPRARISVHIAVLLALPALVFANTLFNGYHLDDIEITRANDTGLRFELTIRNATDGHNVPTGFISERMVWMHTVVTDREGTVVFESGDLDPNGDVRDSHSLYVHNGELPLDKQLFSLQSKFVTRNVRGSEREQVLAVNFSTSPLVFLRPDPRPTSLHGRTLGARNHKMGIPPNGSRTHGYKVKRSMLTGKGPYHIKAELKAGMVPVNLVAEIMRAGFDYDMSPAEIARGVVDGHQVLWSREADVNLHVETADPR